MITVKVTGNPSKAFKILKRLVNEEGIFNTLREQKYFTKKGEKRRLKKERAKARIRKRIEKLMEDATKNY